MPSPFIFRSQLNELIKAILEENFIDSVEFDKDLSKTDLQIELPLRITHKGSNSFFNIRFSSSFSSTYFVVEYFPGVEAKQEYHLATAWSEILEWLKSWINVIQRELSQPDPWILLTQGSILTDSIPDSDNITEKLSEEDFHRLGEFTNSLREFLVSEIKLSQDQFKLIDERLEYLEESAKRQNKRDWAHTAIGVTFTIAIGLALAPEQASKLLALTSEFLRTLFIKLLP
jgi:hypothetical protein